MQVARPRLTLRTLILLLASSVLSLVWIAVATWLWSPHTFDRAPATLLCSVAIANMVLIVSVVRGAKSIYLSLAVVILNVLCLIGLALLIMAFGAYAYGATMSHQR